MVLVRRTSEWVGEVLRRVPGYRGIMARELAGS